MSDQTIETVAEALAGVTITDPDFHGLEREDWRELAAAALKTIREHGKAALEGAVFAYLLAQAWDEGHAAGCADPYKRYSECDCGPNPYRQENDCG